MKRTPESVEWTEVSSAHYKLFVQMRRPRLAKDSSGRMHGHPDARFTEWIEEGWTCPTLRVETHPEINHGSPRYFIRK